MRTSHEVIVDDIFSMLPIRILSIEKFVEIVQVQMANQPQITETIFQKICNKICYIEERKMVLHNYWGYVFQNIPKKKTNLFLMFILYLLCKNPSSSKENLEKYMELFDLYYGDSNTNTETETEGFGNIKVKRKNVKIVGVELREILFTYVKSISFHTIEHFDAISNDKENFREYLKNLWSSAKIWRFITERFFEQKNNLSKQIDLRKFFTKNLEFLVNDSQVRKELADFLYKETRDGEEYLDMSKFRDKN
jgi:hypothetical protein